MTAEQQKNMEDAKAAESTVILVELDEYQVAALKACDALEDRDDMAKSSFASVLRGKVQGKIDRAIKAKYLAEGKGRVAVATECEVEIQRFIQIKRSIE